MDTHQRDRDTEKEMKKPHDTLSLLPMPSFTIFSLSTVALASSIHDG
jgi:hypothetical protein